MQKNIKIFFLCFFFVFITISASYAISVTPRFFLDQDVIFFGNENPYLKIDNTRSGSFAININSFFKNVMFDISPSIALKQNENIKFLFKDFLFGVYFGTSALKMQKDKVSTGLGNSIHFFVPNINNFNPVKEYWKLNYSYGYDSINVKLEYIADTKRIESYEFPKWHSFGAQFFYENMDFIVGLLCDYRFDETDVFHTALESKIVFNNLNVYVVPEYVFDNNHSFNVLCGAELYFLLKDIIPSFILEYYYFDKTNHLAFFMNTELFQFLTVLFGIDCNLSEEYQLQLQSEVAVDVFQFKGFAKYLIEDVKNFESNNRYFSLGLRYEVK